MKSKSVREITYTLMIDLIDNKPKIIKDIIKELSNEPTIQNIKYGKLHNSIEFKTKDIVYGMTATLRDVADKFIVTFRGMEYDQNDMHYLKIVHVEGEKVQSEYIITEEVREYIKRYVGIKADNEEEAWEKYWDGNYDWDDYGDCYDSEVMDTTIELKNAA